MIRHQSILYVPELFIFLFLCLCIVYISLDEALYSHIKASFNMENCDKLVDNNMPLYSVALLPT